VGGHCIPIDPNYLNHSLRTKLGYPSRFVELAHEINATMPSYVAARAQNILNDAGQAINGSRILLLGVTYKPDIADQRESPAVPLARQLNLLGAKITYHDPYVAQWQVPGVAVLRADDLLSAVDDADLVILVQDHRHYPVDELAARARRFFDTRGATTSPTALRL
jgi:UDP-N-acetyl-D-glucosamine dehydrogenase